MSAKEYPDFETPVIVKKVPHILKSRLKVGDKGVMKTPRFQKDTILVHGTYRFNKKTMKNVLVNPPTIAKAGTVKHGNFYQTWYLKLENDSIPAMLFEPFSAAECFDKNENEKEIKDDAPRTKKIIL